MAQATGSAAVAGGPAAAWTQQLNAAPPPATPWGPVAAVLLCLAPMLLLLATTLIRPLRLRSGVALPLSAALLAVIHLAYLSSPPLLVLSSCVVGALEGLVPLAVVWGAVLLFEAAQYSCCLPFIIACVRRLCAGNPVAEVALIGWAFGTLISGVGGFSTPMALAAPMLASLGHDPLRSLVAVVILNGLSAHLGSVGMAVWFGFKSLQLPHAVILHIGLKSAAIVGLASFICAPIAAAYLVGWREVLCNAPFLALSIASGVVPTVLFALFSAELPVVAGGLISMGVTWLLITFRVGLKPHCHAADDASDIEAGPSSKGKDAADSSCSGSSDADGGSTHTRQQPGATAVIVATPAAGSRHAPASPKLGDRAAPARGLAAPPADSMPPAALAAQLLERRSRSLAAAAAAVNAIPGPSQPLAPAELPPCVFHCPSCSLDSRSRATEAALLAAAGAAGAPCGAEPALPALSVVNHATGEHVVVSMTDGRLSMALRLLLHGAASNTPLLPAPPAAAGGATLPTPERAQQAPLLLKHAEPYEEWETDPMAGVAVASRLGPARWRDIVARSLPIWLTVVLLLVTRVPQLHIQDALRSTSPSFALQLGNLATFRMSASLVVQLQDIFTVKAASWKAELLFIPFLLPFVVASVVTLLVHRRSLTAHWTAPFKAATAKVTGIVPALLGALVFAQLIAAGGPSSPSSLLAWYLTAWLGRGYLAVAGLIGALGSFIGGSVLASNITQGAIQAAAATRLGVPVSSLLAVQVAGACAGKLVCISSILSAKVVMKELDATSEAEVVRRTAGVALLFVIIAQALGLIWTLGGVWPD